MRYLAIGDIHGNYDSLIQVMDRCDFDVKNDVLIGIGDYTDGHTHSAEVVEYLIRVPNFIGIYGNHDVWTNQYLVYGNTPSSWLTQGGANTVESYIRTQKFDDPRHRKFFKQLHNYYILTLNGHDYAFVHGGWAHRDGLGHDTARVYTWNRKLWSLSLGCNSAYSEIRTKMYKTVFIGHTQTWDDYPIESKSPPVKHGNIINLDQGAGWDGRLTICDVVTEQCWQSDTNLYGLS